MYSCAVWQRIAGSVAVHQPITRPLILCSRTTVDRRAGTQQSDVMAEGRGDMWVSAQRPSRLKTPHQRQAVLLMFTSSGDDEASERARSRSRDRLDRPSGASVAACASAASLPLATDLAAWPPLVRQGLEACLHKPARAAPRPLLLVSGFSGLGSQERVLAGLQVPFTGLAGAERKGHAVEWLRENGLLSHHHFTEFETLLSREPGFCVVHRQKCPPPHERPEFSTAGFPCQPTCLLRGNHKKV